MCDLSGDTKVIIKPCCINYCFLNSDIYSWGSTGCVGLTPCYTETMPEAGCSLRDTWPESSGSSTSVHSRMTSSASPGVSWLRKGVCNAWAELHELGMVPRSGRETLRSEAVAADKARKRNHRTPVSFLEISFPNPANESTSLKASTF